MNYYFPQPFLLLEISKLSFSFLFLLSSLTIANLTISFFPRMQSYTFIASTILLASANLLSILSFFYKSLVTKQAF
jgi:hypothetical protein